MGWGDAPFESPGKGRGEKGRKREGGRGKGERREGEGRGRRGREGERKGGVKKRGKRKGGWYGKLYTVFRTLLGYECLIHILTVKRATFILTIDVCYEDGNSFLAKCNSYR